MGKFSEILLNSLFISSAYANSFSVPSCNNDTPERRPEMTIEIAEDWFDNNISGQEGFTLDDENEVYRKTILEADLSFAFSADTDDIILSHTVPVTSSGFAIDDTTSISFAEDNVVFQCRYARAIEVDESMTIDPDTQPEVGRGDLTYTMAITAGALGGTTRVEITPNHSFGDEVGARVESCSISHAEHEIYAFHSYNNDVLCRDHTRLNVVQTEFGQNVTFEMRTFRFISAGSSSSEAQDQTIACDLHLDPIADVTSTQPDDCSCHTEAECLNPPLDESNGHVFLMSPRPVGTYPEPRGPAMVPMVLGLNGVADTDINFTIDDADISHFDIRAACAANLNNEMFLLGGDFQDQFNKIRKITNCALQEVGELLIDFRLGGCNTFTFGGVRKAMMCFSSWDRNNNDGDRDCQSFDGTTVQREASSTHQHARVFNMGNYKNSPFVTGHCYPDDNASGFATEIFNYENSEWVQVQDYPFSTGNQISHYATTHTDEGVYILGGWMGPAGRSYTIAEYKDDAWNNAGRMWKRRYAHDALTLGSTAIIFSHEDTDKMELLDLETFEHELIDISASPVNTKLGMFLVPNGYCSAGN